MNGCDTVHQVHKIIENITKHKKNDASKTNHKINYSYSDG